MKKVVSSAPFVAGALVISLFFSCRKDISENSSQIAVATVSSDASINRLVVTGITGPTSVKYPLHNLIDEDISTIWSAEVAAGVYPPDPNSQIVTLRFDTSALQLISYIKLAVFTGNTKVQYVFDVQISADGQTGWTTVLANQKNPAGNSSLVTYDFPDTWGKYLRIIGHGNNGNYPKANSYTELEVYTTEAPPSQPCHIKAIAQEVPLVDQPGNTTRLGTFYYNVYNTLDSVIFATVPASGRYWWDRYYFDHDANHNITRMYVTLVKHPERFYEYTYTWKGGHITKTAVRYDASPNAYYYDSVFYDAQGRVIKDSTDPTHVVQYSYNAAGNLNLNIPEPYDNMTCYLSTDPFFQFLVRDYSKNNAAPARAFTVRNLPVGFTSGFNYPYPDENGFFGQFLTRSITYTCQP